MRIVIAALALAVALAGCGPRPQPVVYQPLESLPPDDDARTPPPGPEPATPTSSQPAARPGRVDLRVGDAPMSLVVSGTALVWTDSAGAIWTMPAHGRDQPKKLSDQRTPDFALHVFTAGRQVFATTRKDLLRVELPAGPVTKANLKLPVLPEESVADGAFIYLTLFQRDDILRVPVGGGPTQKLAELPRGVLALRGDTLFAVSYATGVLVELPAAGGKPRTLARKLPRPTGIAVDERSAFIYCEGDESMHRVDLATGADTVLARDLVNSDEVHLDGNYVYTRSWGKRPSLVRIAKDGSRPQEVIADGLAKPYQIAIDADAVYVTNRDADTIVRVDKTSLPP